MTFNVFKTKEEAISVMARYFVQLAKEAIAEKGRFSVALSGGSTPKGLYELLAQESFREEVDWDRVYFFFGDERYVPHTDENSNYRMAKETMLQPLSIPAEHIFPMDTSFSDPEKSAYDYEHRLRDFFEGKEIKLDLILLGMGDNAHTASLFPYTDVLHDETPGVKAVALPEQMTWRITLNAPMINNAVQIILLVFGKEKSEALQKVLSREPKDIIIDLYPAQLIRKERVAWFTDKEAAILVTQ